MLIQTTKIRTGGTEIDLNGEKLHFKPNQQGDHVCDVENVKSIHRLVVGIPEAYRIYGDDKLPPLPKSEQPEQVIDLVAKRVHVPDSMIITDGEQEIDLMTLEMEELKALASQTFGLAVHHKWNEQTIRTKIVEKTRAS